MPTIDEIQACLGQQDLALFNASPFLDQATTAISLGNVFGLQQCMTYAFACGVISNSEFQAVVALLPFVE
jgi:hypothetical protein